MHRSSAQRPPAAAALLVFFALLPMGCSSEDGALAPPKTPGNASSILDPPPAMPAGLAVEKATDDGFALVWPPNADVDLAGYRVYVYDPTPYRETSYRCANGAALISGDKARFLYSEDCTWGKHYFMLAAVDLGGNESGRFGPLEFNYQGRTDRDDRTNDYSEGMSDGGVLPAMPGSDWWPGRDEADQEIR